MLTHVIIAWLTIFIYSDNAIIVLNNICFPNAQQKYMENESRGEWCGRNIERLCQCKKMELERPKGQAEMKTEKDLIVNKGFCKCLGSKCKFFERFCALLKKALFDTVFFFLFIKLCFEDKFKVKYWRKLYNITEGPLSPICNRSW